jgi:putative ABC transport system permease protein
VIGSALLLAFRNIRRNPMRSALTMLGIVIGVASVVCMVTLGRGTTARVTADVAKLGDRLLMIRAGAPRRMSATVAPPFRAADVRAIRTEVPGLAAVAPTASGAVRVIAGSRNRSTQANGVTNEFLQARGWEIEEGREFTEAELRGGAATCLLGATVRDDLFGATASPLDASIRVGSVSCTVIGVLAAKGQSALGNDQDDLVLMPLVAFQRRIAGTTDISMIQVSVAPEASTADTQRRIEALLRRRRHVRQGEDDDFSVRDMAEISQVLGGVTSALTGLLGGIAAVSLVVGGIGIMNVMLVSVTERTREIGLRLAIGALGRDVLWQFLVESVVLSVLGGLLGVVLGYGVGAVAASKLGLPFVASPDVAVLAFVFSASVGVFFGLYPAVRASRLDPMEALRHE